MRNQNGLLVAVVLFLLCTAFVDAQQVYSVSADGTIRLLQNPGCRGTPCRWLDIDRNRRSIAVAATADRVFQLHDNGAIWHWTGQPCGSDGCPHWQRIEEPSGARAIAASRVNLFQLRRDGSIWRYEGTGSNWERIGANPSTASIAASGEQLFQLRSDGSIWKWRGRDDGWDRLDRNPMTVQIAAAAGELYQRHRNGSIWHWKGRPCAGDSCPAWAVIDNNRNTKTIVAAPGALYQVHGNGHVWKWLGAACVGGRCPSWRRIDANAETHAVAATEGQLYQVQVNGTVLHCEGTNCEAWRSTGTNAFTTYSSSRGGLFVFGGHPHSGSIATAALAPASFGHDTMRFARTSPRQVEMNVLIVMSSYANTSFGPTQTPGYYENRFFGADRRLESYFNRNSRDVGFRINHAGTIRLTDPRPLNCAHRWTSCPGDRRSFVTATVEQLERLPEEQVAGLARYDTNGDGRIVADELFVLKVEGLPDRGPDNPFDDNGGIMRTLPRCAALRGTTKSLCGDFLPVGDETNFITVAHEIAHLFGARDIYGSGSYRYSLMGATWEEGEFFVNLDPWHKMRMGLVTPLIVAIPTARSARQHIRLTHPGNDSAYEPVLFYDPARPNEFFMMEFRRARASSYDTDVAGSGLVIWHVKTDSRFVPVDRTSFGTGLTSGQAVAILGAPDQRHGAGMGWTQAHGTIVLDWPAGGDSGLRLEVRPFETTAQFLTFDWWRN